MLFNPLNINWISDGNYFNFVIPMHPLQKIQDGIYYSGRVPFGSLAGIIKRKVDLNAIGVDQVYDTGNSPLSILGVTLPEPSTAAGKRDRFQKWYFRPAPAKQEGSSGSRYRYCKASKN
jgi:hypothetical protein